MLAAFVPADARSTFEVGAIVVVTGLPGLVLRRTG